MSSSIVVRAFSFAYKAHKGQYRKGSKIPYIVHPMDVASALMKNEASEEIVVAGLLHDVVEDAGVELQQVEKLFGNQVKRLVKGASEPEEYRREMSSEERRKTWKVRKSHTVSKIKDADYDLKLLSCADKLSNIRDMINDYNEVGDKLWNKLNATKEQQSWYYNSMLEAYTTSPSSLVGKPLYNQFKSPPTMNVIAPMSASISSNILSKCGKTRPSMIGAWMLAALIFTPEHSSCAVATRPGYPTKPSSTRGEHLEYVAVPQPPCTGLNRRRSPSLRRGGFTSWRSARSGLTSSLR